MTSQQTPMRKVLALNALSCLLFGSLFAVLPIQTAAFLGTVPEWIVRLVGFGLIANGAHLLLAAARKTSNSAEIVWFSLGDLAWWSASWLLFALGLWVTTPKGIAAMLAVAAVVGGLGLAQMFLLGMNRNGTSARAHWQAIGRSWIALPLWVKLWLTLLNGVFLAALAFLPAEIARLTLAAYIASGPLLLGFAFHQGGLTRHMGAAHLVTFGPLLVWLVQQTANGALPPAQLRYSLVLGVALMLCLAWDIWDIMRWLRGERAVIGQTQPRRATPSPS